MEVFKMRRIFQKVGIKDRIYVEVKDKNGKVKSAHWLNEGKLRRFTNWLRLTHNSMTNTGFAVLAGLAGNVNSQVAFTCVGIGTNSSPAAGPTNTQLGTSIKIKAATVSTVTTYGITNNTLQLVAVFSNALDGLTGTDSFVEVGMFNGTINGTSIMGLRQVYTPADSVNFDQGDSITVTILMQEKQGV
jgi:hypothetical protein